MRSAMAAASTAGRTSWVRMMWAPPRMAATFAAVVALRRSSIDGVPSLKREESEGFLARVCEGKDFIGCQRWERGPFLRAASSMHEDGSAVEFGAGGRHVGVPEVAAHVVDDLASGFDGVAGGGGMEGVDGEDGFGAFFEDGYD